MDKKKPKYLGDEPKPIKVPRLSHKRHEKAQELKAKRKKKHEDFNQAAFRVVQESTRDRS